MDIYPDEKGHYTLFDETFLGVTAAPTEHTVPCVSYVITEKKKPGRLKIEDVTAAVNRNKKALAEKFNLRDPNKIYQVLKEMKPGSTLVFPDGTIINADDIIERPRSGRKVRQCVNTHAYLRLNDLITYSIELSNLRIDSNVIFSFIVFFCFYRAHNTNTYHCYRYN